MKQLIIYYSYEGNTKLIAEEMANATGADLMAIKPLKEMKSKGFMKYVWGGKAAVMKQKPKLEPLTHNMENYDRIIFGTPVWAGTFAPPFNTLFSDFEIKDKKVGIFCCHAGGMGRVFDNFKKQLKDNTLVGQLEIIDPLNSGKKDKIEKSISWINSL
jgi:flavodoxin